MAKKITWPRNFGPSFTPEEMLRAGVFEGKYINDIKGIPAAWKKIPKVLKKEDEPDPKINKFGVKSRQGLSVWKKNGWIKTDKWGWFSWQINFFLGRRLGAEDEWQINRWRSFVARHQGQIQADPNGKKDDKRLAQKQGLLQWGWEWSEKFTEEQVLKNAKRMARITGVELEEEKDDKESVSKESLIILPPFALWND